MSSDDTRRERVETALAGLLLLLLLVGLLATVELLHQSSQHLPPAPTILTGPTGRTSSSTAAFTYTDAESGVGFTCSLDGAPTSPCPDTGVTYGALADGSHTFEVRAFLPGRPAGSSAVRAWVIDGNGATGQPTPGGSPGSATGPTAPGGSTVAAPIVVGNGSVAGAGGAGFGIGGNATGAFSPGSSQTLDLVLANPNPFAVKVQSVSVTVLPGTSNPACLGTQNLVVTRPFTGTVVVPAGSTVSLHGLGVPQVRWPVLEMPNLPVSQDACKSTTFHLAYAGTATLP